MKSNLKNIPQMIHTTLKRILLMLTVSIITFKHFSKNMEGKLELCTCLTVFQFKSNINSQIGKRNVVVKS